MQRIALERGYEALVAAGHCKADLVESSTGCCAPHRTQARARGGWRLVVDDRLLFESLR